MMVTDIFDGYGMILLDDEITGILHDRFGKFEHITEVREHRYYPTVFGIEEVTGGYIFAQKYSSMDPEQNPREFEREIKSALVDFFEHTDVHVQPSRLCFVFDVRLLGKENEDVSEDRVYPID